MTVYDKAIFVTKENERGREQIKEEWISMGGIKKIVRIRYTT